MSLSWLTFNFSMNSFLVKFTLWQVSSDKASKSPIAAKCDTLIFLLLKTECKPSKFSINLLAVTPISDPKPSKVNV